MLISLLILTNVNGLSDEETSGGCTRSISLQIKPCVCKEVVRKRNNETSSSNTLQGTWLYCENRNLNDDEMSGILKKFLSSDMNRNWTRVIDLSHNQLTKMPEEIYQFKRLNKLSLVSNAITSISSRKVLNHDTGNPHQLLYTFISLNFNQLSHIEAGAFEGNHF